MKVKAKCPRCAGPLPVGKTQYDSQGRKIQYCLCQNCGHRVKRIWEAPKQFELIEGRYQEFDKFSASVTTTVPSIQTGDCH